MDGDRLGNRVYGLSDVPPGQARVSPNPGVASGPFVSDSVDAPAPASPH